MGLHSIFATAELRKEEHKRMLQAMEYERSSRLVHYLHHTMAYLKLDARRLAGARRLMPIHVFSSRRLKPR